MVFVVPQGFRVDVVLLPRPAPTNIKLSITHTLNTSSYFQTDRQGRDHARNGSSHRFCRTLEYNFDRMFVQSIQGHKAAEGMPFLDCHFLEARAGQLVLVTLTRPSPSKTADIWSWPVSFYGPKMGRRMRTFFLLRLSNPFHGDETTFSPPRSRMYSERNLALLSYCKIPR